MLNLTTLRDVNTVLEKTLTAIRKENPLLKAGEQDCIKRFRLDKKEAEKSQLNTWLSQEDEKWAADNKATILYTDASMQHEKYIGGYGWFETTKKYSIRYVEYVEYVEYDNATNPDLKDARKGLVFKKPDSNQLELLAILDAVKENSGKLLLVTDTSLDNLNSVKILNMLTGIQQQEIGQLKEKIANDEVRVIWVKGHVACLGNICVDILCTGERIITWYQNHPEETLTGALAQQSQNGRHYRQRKSLIEQKCSAMKKEKGKGYKLHHYLKDHPNDAAEWEFLEKCLESQHEGITYQSSSSNWNKT